MCLANDLPDPMEPVKKPSPSFRPADVCKALLAALDAAEGRRRRRKRDQTPDAIGLAVKRRVLEDAIQGDPDGENFEAWLLEYSQENTHAAGAVSAMARSVLDEWRLAQSMDDFKTWLDYGAPSDDADAGSDKPRR